MIKNYNYRYLINCVQIDRNKDVWDLQDMIDKARQITYRTFMRYANHAEVRRVFPQYAWGHCYRGGLRMYNDYHVRYFRSTYKGQSCVYVVHSAIEYIFT